MVTELQFAAVAAYLLWCLVSSLTGVFGIDQDGHREPRKLMKAIKSRKSPLPGNGAHA